MQVSLKEIRRLRKKTKPDGFFVDVILRGISIYITKMLLYFPITPNMVTSAGICLTIAATILFAYGNYLYSIIASFLLFFAYLCDCIDGEVARCRKISSVNGSYYDDISFTLIEILPILGITIGLHKKFQNDYIFYAGMIFLFSISFLRIIAYLKFMILYKDVLIVQHTTKSSQKINTQADSEFIQRKDILFSFIKPIKAIVYSVYHLSGFITGMIIFSLLDKIIWLFLFYAATYPVLLILTLAYQLLGRFDRFIKTTSAEIYDA